MSQVKQLKKNDFLAAVTEEPQTKGEIVDSLEDYEFLGSWLDYLIDHFKNLGRIIVNEDGTIQRKVKGGSSGPRIAYRVVLNEDGAYEITEREVKGNEQLDKDAGEAGTPKAAIKRATSAAFKAYKDNVDAIKALEVSEE